MRTDPCVNYWIMLTSTPNVFVISPLSGLLRDQLLTFALSWAIIEYMTCESVRLHNLVWEGGNIRMGLDTFELKMA